MGKLITIPVTDLPCGCKKVNELVPNVRLARFQRESLPSLRGLLGAGDLDGEDCSGDGSDMIMKNIVSIARI